MRRWLLRGVSCLATFCVRLFGLGLRLLGVAALLWLLAALTPLPWNLLVRMASDLPGMERAAPEVLVVLGGGGIPSESGLMRTYAGARYARVYPDTDVVVAMPSGDGDPTNQRMVDELTLRGVAAERIRQETAGRNTREQADRCRAMLEDDPVVGVVTSPEHMRRALLSFQAAGFDRVRACPAWDDYLEVDLRYEPEELPARSWNPVGGSLLARYQFWDRLVLQAKLLREGVALLYYRWMGWVGAADS